MTRFAYIRRDGRCVLHADGHADFCPGRDIVCAGASALMCALAGALDALGAQGVELGSMFPGILFNIIHHILAGKAAEGRGAQL